MGVSTKTADRIVEDSASYAKATSAADPSPTDHGLGRLLPAQPDRSRGPQRTDHPARIFRPVATFEVFDDENDAIYRANATEFGLAAGVFTRDVDRARRTPPDQCGNGLTNT